MKWLLILSTTFTLIEQASLHAAPFLSPEGQLAAEELQKESENLFPTVRVGKVKVKLSAKNYSQKSLFDAFLADSYAATMQSWMTRAIESYERDERDPTNPLIFTGCETVSEYARGRAVGWFGRRQPLECTQVFKNRNLVQFEFHVDEYKGQLHQNVAVTSDIFHSGPNFVFRDPVAPQAKVIVRSDSWDTIVRSEILPGQVEFSDQERILAAGLLGLGRFIEGRPTNLYDLTRKFYNNQSFRMGMHNFGVALEVVGAAYFIYGMATQAVVGKTLQESSEEAVKHLVRRNMAKVGLGHSLTAKVGLAGKLGQGGVKSLSGLFQARVARAIIAKNILIQATNGLASTSLLVHALHIEQMLDYLDDPRQRDILENAIHIIHAAAITVGMTNGVVNIASHVGRHGHHAHQALGQVGSHLEPGMVEKSLQVIREHRVAHAVSKILKKPVNKISPEFWAGFWSRVKDLGGEWQALMEVSHIYGHSHSINTILQFLACPFDDIAVALPSIIAGGSRHNHTHDHGSSEEHPGLPLSQNATEEVDLIMTSSGIALEQFASEYPEATDVDYAASLVGKSVKVKVWGVIAGELATRNFFCHKHSEDTFECY